MSATLTMHAVPCNPFFLHWFGECLRRCVMECTCCHAPCKHTSQQAHSSNTSSTCHSTRDYVGFCVAMSSICFWIVAQFPQYYKNYKTKTVEALSPWFLAQWLLVRKR